MKTHYYRIALITLIAVLGLTSYLPLFAADCALRGTGDLGLIIERANGSVQIVDTSHYQMLFRVTGLGDLSHASAVYSRDQRFVYIFARDGGLSKVDMLCGTLVKRIVQAGNSIGGAISQHGDLIAVSNYEPGGVNIFKADDLSPVASIPALDDNGKPSKVVGLVDAPGNRLVFSLYDAGQIWVADLQTPQQPKLQQFKAVGQQPYDALITPEGRYYIAGLFGEDGLALLDLWQPEQGVKRILPHYGKGQQPLPVYKMPHLEGWAVAGNRAFMPAVGQHQVLVANQADWQSVANIAVKGQPVFVRAQPDGRRVWVNFALPDNDTLQLIDTLSLQVVATLNPGPGVLHMEFTPRGEAVWVSVRDKDEVQVYATQSLALLATLPALKPSGIFMTARAQQIGF